MGEVALLDEMYLRVNRRASIVDVKTRSWLEANGAGKDFEVFLLDLTGLRLRPVRLRDYRNVNFTLEVAEEAMVGMPTQPVLPGDDTPPDPSVALFRPS